MAPDITTPSSGVPTILTDVDGRQLAAGSSFVLSANVAGLATDLIDHVDFYADGQMFASFAGDGTPRTAGAGTAAERPARREGAAPSISGALYQARYVMPGLDKLVNMIVVAVSKQGISQVSQPVAVQARVSSNRPLQVALGGLVNGSRVFLPFGLDPARTPWSPASRCAGRSTFRASCRAWNTSSTW